MRAGLPRTTIIFLHDMLMAGLSFLLAAWLSNGGYLLPGQLHTLEYGVPVGALLAGACFYTCGLHRRLWSFTSPTDLIAIARACALAILLLFFLAFVFDGLQEIPRSGPIVQWLVLVVLLSAARLLYRATRERRLAPRQPAPAHAKVPVLVYGCGPLASLFIRAAQTTPGGGLQIAGVIDGIGDRCGRYLNGVPILGQARDLERILVGLAVQGVHPQKIIVTCPPAEIAAAPEGWAASTAGLWRYGLQVEYLPDLLSLGAAIPAPLGRQGGSAVRAYFRLRRIIDLSLSAAALLLFLPLFALVALAVLADVGQPVLFRQLRPGRGMRFFTLYKFRTMRPPAGAAAAARGADPARTSALGRLLRRSRLDELPQLYNVLIGDMALIGPRPLLPRDLPGAVASERSLVRPGLTGWAQVNGGDLLSAEEKLALDLWYLRHAGPLVDARILWRTLRTMLVGERIDREVILALAFEETAPGPAAPAPLAGNAAAERAPQLLVVNRYFHPDRSATAQLLTDLVATAAREGIATTVLTSRQLYHEPGATLPARERHRGARVRRLWATRSGRSALPGRALDCATFCASVFFALLDIARAGDVILAKTDPPLLSVAAWAAARIKGAELISWCQDLFPEVAAATGVSLARGPLGRVLRALRNASLRGAAVNVAVCETMAERLRAQGIPAERLTVIHNWADGASIRPIARDQNRLRQQWALGDRFVIGYSGNLGRVHDVETLIELIDVLGEEPEIIFLLIGAGAGYDRLRRRAGERGLGNVMLRPYQPKEQLGQSLTVPDLHIVSLRPNCEGLVMPSKLYGALAAGRPVISIGDAGGSVARIVRAHDAGLVVAPGQVARAALEIRALRADPPRLARMGANARRAYESAFSREASLSAWIHCLRSVLPAEVPMPDAVAAE